MANVLIIVTYYSNVQLILKSPLLPLFQRGKSFVPLFGKEGLGEIRMSIWIIELELMRLH